MLITRQKLKKLRGKSIHEIGVRSRQELSKLGERVFGSTVEMNDSALLKRLAPSSRNGSAEGTTELILERIIKRHVFFPALGSREEIATIIERRFPVERRALIERADRAIDARFDLLGLEGLSFGDPIDWRLEPTSGRRTGLEHWSKIDYLHPDVAGDKKVTWELNRHSHFVTLGQAYWLTGDEKYCESFITQATSWMDANPVSRGINWASSLEVAFRAIAWLWALHLFAASHKMRPHFAVRLLKQLWAHGRHVNSYLSHYFSANTHLTGEALALFYLGTALPEFREANRWRETGLQILLEQMPKHIGQDGVYFEQSSYYQRYTADFYTHLLVLARASGARLPAEVEERLALAVDHLMWITRPDGSAPLVGDDDGGRLITLATRNSNDYRDTIATAAAIFNRGDWKFVAGEAKVETLWLLGPAGLKSYDEIEPRTPAACSRAFTEGGYYVMRDGWSRDSSYVLIDCGPHGSSSCGHAHADALAFEFAANGKTWLVDPGTFTYTGNQEMRDHFRSTHAHNTVTVDDESQSVTSGPFSWQHVARAYAKQFISQTDFDYFEGSHDGYEQLADPVTHTRSVLFAKQHPSACLIVKDRFQANDQHTYALRYHFPAGCSAEADGNQVIATSNDGQQLKITVIGNTTTTARIEEGWVSEAYGRRDPAQVAVFEATGSGAQELFSFISLQTESL
ncbi:MAG TPA: alginate lyase family protein [Blastocatellia bacterium]|nr:alginate lyase family protein [Blastocatellia bacterium]